MSRLLELVSVAVQFVIDLFDVPCLDNNDEEVDPWGR